MARAIKNHFIIPDGSWKARQNQNLEIKKLKMEINELKEINQNFYDSFLNIYESAEKEGFVELRYLNQTLVLTTLPKEKK